MNLVVLQGNVVREPEARYSQEGKMVTSFSVATNERRGDKENTEYHNCVAFGREPGKDGVAGVIAEYVKKGTKVLVTGKIKTRSYENKDGQKVYRTEIIVDQFELLSPKGQRGEPSAEPPDESEGLPF